jgi:hypothetical protein
VILRKAPQILQVEQFRHRALVQVPDGVSRGVVQTAQSGAGERAEGREATSMADRTYMQDLSMLNFFSCMKYTKREDRSSCEGVEGKQGGEEEGRGKEEGQQAQGGQAGGHCYLLVARVRRGVR